MSETLLLENVSLAYATRVKIETHSLTQQSIVQLTNLSSLEKTVTLLFYINGFLSNYGASSES